MNRIRRVWQRLSKREKLLVAVSFTIFSLLLGRSWVLEPFLDRRASVEKLLDSQPQFLERNLRYLERKTEIMGNLEKTRAELNSLEPLLLTGDTASVSASELQQMAQGFASGGGAQVVSTRVLNPEAMGTFTRIPIQLEVSGVIDQVANMIRGIETAPKLLVINEINVRSLAVGGPRRPDGAAPAPIQNLRVSLTVSGYIRSQPAAPSKSTSAAPAKKGPPSKEIQDLEEMTRRRRSEE
jgi:Tfp pilus assembly protein PilO